MWFLGNNISLFSLCSYCAGFRDRKETLNLSNRSQTHQKPKRKNSVESQHSFRSTGSGSHVTPPHVSTRVVLGRETSPVPVTTADTMNDKPEQKRLPKEIMDKFSGQSREVRPGLLTRAVQCQLLNPKPIQQYLQCIVLLQNEKNHCNHLL